MSETGSGVDHDAKRFASEQAQILVEHLGSECVDFAFVARHAATILQLAESQIDGAPLYSDCPWD
jgi:hypothetical protein